LNDVTTISAETPAANRLAEYRAFLADKVRMAPAYGFDVDPDEVNPLLKPHQRRHRAAGP
jgi:hypothetical protein